MCFRSSDDVYDQVKLLTTNIRLIVICDDDDDDDAKGLSVSSNEGDAGLRFTT